MASLIRNTALCLIVFFLTISIGYSQAGDGLILYATDGRSCTASTLYELDPSDGSVVRTIGSTGVSGLTGLAEHPTTGVLYAISTGGQGCTPNLYTLNKDTGAATLVGPLGESGGKPDMAFRADGTLFTYSTSNGYLGTVDLTTGAMTLIGDTGVEPWDQGLTFDGSGTLIMIDGDTVYTVNTSTGSATYVTEHDETNDANMMTTHPTTGDIYVADSDNSSTTTLNIMNPTTGAFTLLGSNSIPNMCAIAFGGGSSTPANIPTLSEWGVIFMSLILVATAVLMMRRRRIA